MLTPKPMKLEIAFKLQCCSKQSDATGLYIGWCPALDMMSQGRSAEQARASLDDSIRLYLHHCLKRGVLDEALARLGFTTTNDDGIDDADVDVIHVREQREEVVEDVGVDCWTGEYSVPLHVIANLRKRTQAGESVWQPQ